MDLFEDLLKERHHHRDQYRHHKHRQDEKHYPSGKYEGWGDHHASRHRDSAIGAQLLPLVQQLLQNRTLLIALGLVALLLLVLAVVALIYLLPLVLNMLGYVGENGIKGVLDQVAALLNQLWLGSGKQ